MDIMLFINSTGHLLVDAVCAAAIFGPLAETGELTSAVLLYNTLAFSTQCVVGLFTDRLRRHGLLAAAALAAVALGFLLPMGWLIRVAVVGLGNSIFHVAAGTVTLKRAGGRAGPLGVFVAPGTAGLALGTLYPALGTYFAAVALLICLPMARLSVCAPAGLNPPQDPEEGAPAGTPWPAVAALLLAVAVRAVGGTAVSFPWKTGAAQVLIMAGFVYAGKTAGGFVCDRLGAEKTAMFSLPAAAAVIAFCSPWPLPSLLGQLLLNLTMPVTLWLVYRAMPDSPGLAFGLAASALWPGTIAGGLLKLTGPALWGCILVSFLFGLLAIRYANKKIREVPK